MQLPPADELVLVSGLHPIRANKARFYDDARLKGRVLPPPSASSLPPAKAASGGNENSTARTGDDWSAMPQALQPADPANAGHAASVASEEDPDNAGIRREPELPEHEAVVPEQTVPACEFEFAEEDREEDEAAVKARLMRRQFGSMARQASLDPDDGIGL